MTPPADRPPVALPVDDRPVLRVRDQGELVAAVPAMLGFHPRESLVLMATGGRSGRRLGLTLRVDLPPPEHPQYAEHAELVVASAVRGLLLDEPTGAIAVVVSEAGPLPHSLLACHVESALDAQRIPIQALMWAERTAGGAGWACYESCGCAGLVPEPAATPFVAAVVAEGRVVHADRAALEAVVAPADPAVLRRREERLIRAADGELDGAEGGIVLDPAAGMSVVDAAIADAAAGRLALADDGIVVALATALGMPEVRAWALRRSAAQDAAVVEQVWAALARETPDPEAAEPATLLAVSALLRGDGALANIALDRAERAWPGHAFAALVRRAATAGLRPSSIREMLTGGDR
ncbi:uncharacterized protein DUF4192 [Pseudonocardia hierapolitana]|uniref:Uncharacterized protein DUF4192 n=1 Tax=Pseudonocardia hierapolitana TaxID=1128676 RepID=A0A561SIX0_9PSEU|nr:DUF4192 domain-containing protein [Pseudonocardia hierapolitana]TWF74820.1 uncharacterized protein DUF4192 [Pseudonocardia hierapolitana]